MSIRIQKVRWAKVDLVNQTPVIEAHGETLTGGYTNPQLDPVIYVHPPADGIWDFTFVVDPPTGPTIQVITPHTANYIMPHMLPGFKGVRVHGNNGTVVALI